MVHISGQLHPLRPPIARSRVVSRTKHPPTSDNRGRAYLGWGHDLCEDPIPITLEAIYHRQLLHAQLFSHTVHCRQDLSQTAVKLSVAQLTACALPNPQQCSEDGVDQALQGIKATRDAAASIQTGADSYIE